MSDRTLIGFVDSAAEQLGIPGVAAGVWARGQQTYACHGVTSVENPLPVDRDSVFVMGSIAKTFTATARERSGSGRYPCFATWTTLRR